MTQSAKIDIEPKWEDILDEMKKVIGCHLSPAELIEELRTPCYFTDIIRKAQKEGHKTITFRFHESGIEHWTGDK